MANIRKRLSVRTVDGLRPRAAKYDVLDTGAAGLILRVHPTGGKVWYVRGRLVGRDTWRKLGTYHRKHFNVTMARGLAAKYRAAFDRGTDPDEPPPTGEVNTVGDLWLAYTEDVATLGRKASGIASAKQKYKTFLAAWADRPLTEITRAEVRGLVNRTCSGFVVDGVKHGGPTAANRARALLSAMWQYADETHHPPNPCRGIAPKAEVGRRTLVAADRVPDFLAAVEDQGGAFADAVLLGLLTGLRRSNLTGLRWEWCGELAPDGAEWTLRPGELGGNRPGLGVPAAEFKSGRPFLLPLVPRAVEILRRRQSAALPGAWWVFPSDKAYSGHLGDSRYRWARLVEFLCCEDVNRAPRDDPRPGWHVLRHTLARTLYGLAPFGDAVAEILGHSRVARLGVTAGYVGANPEAVRPYLEAAALVLLGDSDAEANAAPSVVVPFTRDQSAG